jgi:hypothetical protein
MLSKKLSVTLHEYLLHNQKMVYPFSKISTTFSGARNEGLGF